MFIINNNKNKGVINMNNLKKIGLSSAGSLVAFSANAGSMSVSGSAGLTCQLRTNWKKRFQTVITYLSQVQVS